MIKKSTHPDPDKVRELGQLFLMMHEAFPEAEVSMGSPYWDIKHPCGTPACHAGWYAIGIGKEYIAFDCNFSKAADSLAQDLGFRHCNDLEEWARKNSNIWGNSRGFSMFADRTAFHRDLYRDKELTLETIGIHWLKVADRIEEENVQA